MGRLHRGRLLKVATWFAFFATLYEPLILLVQAISLGNASALVAFSAVVIGLITTIASGKYLVSSITVALVIVSCLPKLALSSYIGFVFYTVSYSIARRYELPTAGESTPVARRSIRRTLLNLVLSMCLTALVSILPAVWLSRLISSTRYFSPIATFTSLPITRLFTVFSIVLYMIPLTIVLTGVFTDWTLGLVKIYRRLRGVPLKFLETCLFIFIFLYCIVIHLVLLIPTGLSIGRSVNRFLLGAIYAAFSTILSVSIALIPVKALEARFNSLPKYMVVYVATLSLALYTTAVLARFERGAGIILAVFTPDFDAVFSRISSSSAVANTLDYILRYGYEILGVM